MMMTFAVFWTLLLAAGTLAAPGGYDERALRELVELLQKKVNEHQQENQLLRDTRMVYLTDVQEDHIWLVMQRDVRWGPEFTFEVDVTDADTGESRRAQEPITWGALDHGHDVTDGKLKGYKRAIKITGLSPGHEYRVSETVRRGPGGKEVFTKSKLYTTPVSDGSNGGYNSLFGNSAGDRPAFDDPDTPGSDNCRRFYVCRDGNGAKWQDDTGNSWYENDIRK